MTKRLRKVYQCLGILAILHFFWNVAGNFFDLEDTSWIVQQSCYFRETKKIFNSAESCNKFYHRKAFLAASPQLAYGESLDCQHLTPEEFATLKTSQCTNDPFWGSPVKRLNVGFDAYSVWYQRAAVLYARTLQADWPGHLNAIQDVKFIESFPSPEIRAYPWLLPIVYAKFLEWNGSWNPMILQILQVLIFALVAWLYYLTWPRAPRSLWLAFAFVPIAGKFVFSLYADLWLTLFGLFAILALERHWRWMFFAAALALTHTKQEGSLLLILILSTWCWLSKSQLPRKSTLAVYFLSSALAIASYKIWSSQWSIPHQFGISVVERLGELQTYTQRLPRIYLYYTDVFFRPALWMFLWPATIWILLKKESLEDRRAILPLLLAIVVIPVFFLRFPDGAFKETVLTGTNRALWQLLPIAWMLLSRSRLARQL